MKVRVTVEVGVGSPRHPQALVIALQAMFLRRPGAPAQLPEMLMLAGIPRCTRSRLLTADGIQVVMVVTLCGCQSGVNFFWLTSLPAYMVEYSVTGSAALVKVDTVVGTVVVTGEV
jgi:hypothetical protein